MNFKNYRVVLKDIVESALSIRAVLFFAHSDLRARYKRSFLGPLWIVLTTSIGVVGLGYLWAAILNLPRSEMIPSLTYGLIVWQFISGAVVEAPGVFVRNASTIRNIKTPYFLFVFIAMSRHLMNFLHNCIVLVIVYCIYAEPSLLMILYSCFGLLLLLANLIWCTALIGCIGARFRDVEPLIASIMPIIFFLSPVIYKADNLGNIQSIVWFNPFSYFISIVRDPLLGTLPQPFVYFGAFSFLCFGILITFIVLGKYRARIPFWI